MAGRAKRNAAREMRRKKKASAKAARTALYASYRDSGKNSKRAKKRAKNKGAKHSHAGGACGNIGCLRDSQVARMAHHRLLVRIVGPAKANALCEKRGWF